MAGEVYCPTEQEIRAMCQRIRADWSEQTERSRRVMQPTEFELPMVHDPKPWLSGVPAVRGQEDDEDGATR